MQCFGGGATGAARRTGGEPPAHTSASIFEVSATKVDLTDVVASIRVRYSSLDVDHADPAKSSTADGWGFAQIAFGGPDITLTSTSMPRWSDGNPTKAP
jgi:hypothetical protein